MRGAGVHVDVLQGVCGVAYRVGFFSEARGGEGEGAGGRQRLMRPPAECFTSDDIWISGQLAMAGISRVLIGGQFTGAFAGGLDPADAPWKHGGKFDHSLQLSAGADANPRRDVDCVEAVERAFGRRWPRAAGTEPSHEVVSARSDHTAATPLTKGASRQAPSGTRPSSSRHSQARSAHRRGSRRHAFARSDSHMGSVEL
jgi:hypothetical protein